MVKIANNGQAFWPYYASSAKLAQATKPNLSNFYSMRKFSRTSRKYINFY